MTTVITSPDCIASADAARERVLDLARWAPSGDNTQVWRFQHDADGGFTVLGHDTRDEVVYDYNGRASQFALGALLETIRIAATTVGRQAVIERLDVGDTRSPRWHVALIAAPGIVPDHLAAQIEHRTTNRLPFSTRQPNACDWLALAHALGGHRLRAFTSLADRWRMARLLTGFGWVRYSCPECWEVHRKILDFDHVRSADRVPVRSLGADPLTEAVMRWSMREWARLRFLNRWLGGTIAPCLRFDLLPALRCAGVVAIVAPGPIDDLDSQIAAGAAVQRLWLTATSLGLSLQPAYTPISFAGMVRDQRRFTHAPGVWERATHLVAAWNGQLGFDAERTVFAARIGFARAPYARSVRRKINELMVM